MFSKEYRPLKRPKLGVPDYYPQESKQKEDDLSYNSLNHGFRSHSVLPSGEEFQGALKEFSQHFLTTKEYCLRVNQVDDERRRRRWVQDTEKKKLQVSKDNFFLVPMGRNRKEIATQWFMDLSSNKPLSQLAKRVPIFNKKEEIFDNLCEKDVPISRAAWYIKMNSAHTMMTDPKLAKKKQATDPSFEWTLSLTKYMNNNVWRICNESQLSGRHDNHSGRTSSTSGGPSPSDETLMEITHWQYMLHLSSWLYEENLLVKYDFLRWLVERIEHVKSTDTKALQLHLPLVLRHLLDIANCVSLARPLVTYCCKRLAALFELEQQLHKLHPVVKPEPPLESVPEAGEDDSVFSEPYIKQEPGKGSAKSHKRSTDDRKENPSPTPIVNNAYEDNLYFHWCSHHQAVMLELVCTIQTIAIRCPTAFVQMKIPGGRGILIHETDKVSSPLTILPCSLSELPMPTSLKPELQKKLLSGLAAAEAEIVQRNKAAESRWSSMTVADLQTTSEGSKVKQILKLLDALDKSSFTTSSAHNPLTTLYCRIAEVQRSSKTPLSDDMLIMLLCKWATTPHRYGDHRPLVTTRILAQRQNDIIKGENWSESYDKNVLDDSWEEPYGVERLCESPYCFQQTLVKFLDTRAPLPDDLSAPVQPTEPFFRLIVLFAELIRLDIFSYRQYLSTLIARGESRPPIIPCLPFACEGESDKSRKRQELNLSIPLPAIKKLRCSYDQSEVSIVSGPSSPISSSSFGGIGLTTALDSLITSSPSNFQQEHETEAIFEDRVKKLKMLEHESSTHIMSLDFNTSTTDAPSSPVTGSKTDPFDFSLPLLDDDQVMDSPLNKQSSRQLIFAAYFPITDSQLSLQTLNERSVVLCGVGRSRNKVETIVKKITQDVEQYYQLLDGDQRPILPEEDKQSVMTGYQSLPTFEQNIIATACETKLRESLSPFKSIYPCCAQLVFVCELLKVCGSISQILQLLVDILACNAFITEDDDSHRFMDPRSSPLLPLELRLPVIGMLQRYSSCLMLSQQDTTVVFEGLFRILTVSPKSVSSHKTVFLFLHKLYTDCSYLQKTFRPTFGNYCVKYGEKFGLSIDWCKPTATEADWQRTNILQMLSKPNACDLNSLCNMLKPSMSPFFNTFFVFAVDVFSLACQKTVNYEMLSQLAFVCAEVCCDKGGEINSELLGAFRALCIPNQSTTKTGFTALTNKTNIIIDPSIHSSILVFVCLLISHNIFRLQDIIVYIIIGIIYVQFSGSSHQNYRSLEFAASLIVHLLVPDYSQGHPNAEYSPPVRLPPFVQDTLHAKCRELNIGHIILLLKNLLKISNSNVSRGSKMGSLLIQSSGPSNEATLGKVRGALETVASQDWIRDKCSKQGSRLLETDMLSDTSLTPSQSRWLLHLLCPYSPSVLPSHCGTLAKTEPNSSLEHILKNLDQWTLRNALLHIDHHIQQTTSNGRVYLQEHLASVVIHIFEDSCGDEFLGQTIECSMECGDGSHSPRVWLVTPLISQLTQSVLGRVLKSAGNILGQGQWWNPEKNQEKRRSTRATSGVAPPKTGLQWQQPFLELVLACMHAQTNTHEELLGPLKSQLSTFLSAYDREGTPADEQSKTMLFAAIKLRLSLVGSMLVSICSTESFTLEWVPLLMQLICSGAVDRQTDTSELFTNCLDMLCTLLHSLPSEFHTSLVTAGEEGKKAYVICVKKLKSELNGAKSYCVGEIQQLFPLAQEAYTVTTVKQPDSLNRKTFNTFTERIKGLRVQDSRDISPWDILEGVKSNGPLMLSWFGGVRVKRKPLRFEEQRWLLRFHTHQEQFKDMMCRPYFVKLPEAVDTVDTSVVKPPEVGQTPGVEGGKMDIKAGDSKVVNQPAPGTGNQPLQPQAMPQNIPQQFPRAPNPRQVPPQAHGMMKYPPYQQDNRLILNQIRERALLKGRAQQQQFTQRPPMYPQQHPRMMHAGMTGNFSNNPAAIQRMMLLKQHHQRKVMEQQLQQQRAQMAMQGQYPPGGGYHPGMQPGGNMQPMQANPPVPMHQVMQGFNRQAMMPQQAPGNMMVPGNQPGMQYPPQHPPPAPAMNTMHRPMF